MGLKEWAFRKGWTSKWVKEISERIERDFVVIGRVHHGAENIDNPPLVPFECIPSTKRDKFGVTISLANWDLADVAMLKRNSTDPRIVERVMQEIKYKVALTLAVEPELFQSVQRGDYLRMTYQKVTKVKYNYQPPDFSKRTAVAHRDGGIEILKIIKRPNLEP